MRRPALLLLVCLLPCRAAAEWRSAGLALRASHDSGGVFVSSSQSGFGGGAALRAGFGSERVEWLLGIEVDIAGYTAEGDGDPIALLTGSVSRRQGLGTTRRFFWLAGAGAGLVGIAGSGAVFPVKAALGFVAGPRRPVSLEIAAFDRLAFVVTGSGASWDTVNSLGVEVSLRFGR